MTMGTAIKICFSKYVKFEGKASRSEYWYFWLFCFCMEIIPAIFAFIIDKEEIRKIIGSNGKFQQKSSIEIQRKQEIFNQCIDKKLFISINYFLHKNY